MEYQYVDAHIYIHLAESQNEIWARLYVSDCRPCQVLVPTWFKFPLRAVGPCFPLMESILEDAKIQPYIHDCIVNVIEGAHTY